LLNLKIMGISTGFEGCSRDSGISRRFSPQAEPHKNKGHKGSRCAAAQRNGHFADNRSFRALIKMSRTFHSPVFKTRAIILWLTLIVACVLPSCVLTSSALENRVWDIYRAMYDAANLERIVYDSCKKSSLFCDETPIHNPTDNKTPSEISSASSGQISEFPVAEETANTAKHAVLGSRVTIGVGVRSVDNIAATELADRISPEKTAALQSEYGTEFAQIYITGPGPNGGGGTYYLIQGDAGTVTIPISPNVRLISHTHPETLGGGIVPLEASPEDMNVLQQLQNAGSPQSTSQIVAQTGNPFTFTN
jgi:hypothetical protein